MPGCIQYLWFMQASQQKAPEIGSGVYCTVASWCTAPRLEVATWAKRQSVESGWQGAEAQTTAHSIWLQVLLNDPHDQGAIHVHVHLALVLKARKHVASIVCIFQDLLLRLLYMKHQCLCMYSRQLSSVKYTDGPVS